MSASTQAAPEPEVRAFVYETCLSRGLPPSVAEIAKSLNLTAADARARVQRLAEAHVLYPQPDGEILMAPPFSAVPTPFPVQAGGVSSFGNCIWDALGIIAMMQQDGTVSTSCGCCGARLTLAVVGGALRSDQGTVHFAVPAKHWWDNIVFT